MALNDNIKKFREEKNLTQQQLADKLYVSNPDILNHFPNDKLSALKHITYLQVVAE